MVLKPKVARYERHISSLRLYCGGGKVRRMKTRGDAGRYREMQGGAGRCREMQGDAGRCREIGEI